MLTLEELELPTADELDAEIRRRLAPLDDDPADFHPVFAARKRLDDVEERLPDGPEIVNDDTSAGIEKLRDRIPEWRDRLQEREAEVRAALVVEMKTEGTEDLREQIEELEDETSDLKEHIEDLQASAVEAADGGETATFETRLKDVEGARVRLERKEAELEVAESMLAGDSGGTGTEQPTDKEKDHARTVLEATADSEADEFETYASVERWLQSSDSHDAPPTAGGVVKGAKRAADALGHEHENGASLIRGLRKADEGGRI